MEGQKWLNPIPSGCCHVKYVLILPSAGRNRVKQDWEVFQSPRLSTGWDRWKGFHEEKPCAKHQISLMYVPFAWFNLTSFSFPVGNYHNYILSFAGDGCRKEKRIRSLALCVVYHSTNIGVAAALSRHLERVPHHNFQYVIKIAIFLTYQSLQTR